MLAENPTKKFIVMSHVFPGLHYHISLETLWRQEYTDLFYAKLYPYQDNMILQVGAHIHRVNYFAP